MDVFAKIKNYVPEKPDSVLNTIITTMRSLPKKVYVSDSLKAIIDLEIDLLLESGGVLQHCERCGEYFIRDKDYDYDYCSKAQPGGRTCLEMSTAVPPRTADEIRRLEDMTKELYTYMSKRINVDLTQRDFAEWYQSFMAIKESILHNALSISEFREFEKYSHDLHFAPVKQTPLQEKPSVANVSESTDTAKKQPEVKPFVFERVDRSVLYEQENRRRKQEQERELYDMMQESAAPVQQEAVAPQNETPKAPVHVVKAGETDKLDVSLFENPFDNAFESEISELEKVSGYDFKPLDDIFSFGGADDKLQQTPGGYTDEGTADEDSSDKDNNAYTEPAVDTGFAGEFAKADYSIKHSVTPKSNYAANMYRHTVETTQTPAEDFPDVQQSGEHLTQDDFDILPSSPSLTVPVGEKTSVKALSLIHI